MKKSEIIKIAMDNYLWDGTFETKRDNHIYICLALDKVEMRHGFEISPKVAEIKAYISSVIDPHPTVIGWLRRTHNVLTDNTTDEEIQAYRKAWCQHLINHYLDLGD